MAACLFSRKRTSKGHEQELRKELLQSPRVGIENYPSRKALRLIYLTVNATLSHARFEEKGRDKKNKKAAFTVAVRMKKFLLNFQTLTSVAVVHESQRPKLVDERDEVFYSDLVATR